MDITKYFSGGFPLTTERLIFMQNAQNKAIEQLTKLAGSGNIIVEGLGNGNLDVSQDINVPSGIIIVDGEIIAFEESAYNSRVAIFETVTNVAYNEDVNQDGDLDMKIADVVRVARCAATGGVDSFQFSTLKRIKNLQAIEPLIGEVKFGLFDLNNLPLGWRACDGQDGRPNMTGIFPVGAGVGYPLGQTGGAASVTLTEGQMPSHNHNGSVTIPPHTHGIDNAVKNGGGGSNQLSNNSNIPHSNISQTDSGGGATVSYNTSFKGNNEAHENRPPFLAFNYIIYIGI